MTWRIEVQLPGDRIVGSPGFASREEAEAELNEIRREMSYNSPTERTWLAVSNALASVKAAWLTSDGD